MEVRELERPWRWAEEARFLAHHAATLHTHEGDGAGARRIAGGGLEVEVARALKDGAKPGDIALLSLAGQARSALCKAPRLGEVPVVRADAADAREHVVADTFLRSKGLERPIVIVTELSGSTERYDVRMHVAATRATVQCVVVGTEEEIARDARLGAVGRVEGRAA